MLKCTEGNYRNDVYRTINMVVLIIKNQHYAAKGNHNFVFIQRLPK